MLCGEAETISTEPFFKIRCTGNFSGISVPDPHAGPSTVMSKPHHNREMRTTKKVPAGKDGTGIRNRSF